MKTVTLTTCADSFEAHLLKGALASEGIECILTNENMNQIYAGQLSLSIGVLVLEKDLEEAQKILQEIRDKDNLE